MAKWGEGDPRWIVEERADSHNVNNWHWKEIDSSDWSKNFLQEALPNIEIDDKKLGNVKITEVSSMEGDSTCSIRKQKFIFIFDWEKISLKWKGRVKGEVLAWRIFFEFGCTQNRPFGHLMEKIWLKLTLF